ncbi:hypothetical protein QTJ16_000664 [Diplocarpon rosae]|uniref:Zn(2)-C6 fungal-type domain-containing protein n=1 Tax=Diplocarpon rosae TaxID=946125 RepID=A0AAD9T741_9HELO|nr:hypothetical protein QTJ16_000664 [Diplocarpon rosae]
MATEDGKQRSGRRTVCDHCRRRRIRCDGEFPCVQCGHASLTCRREHVPRKRGPKRGNGRVLNELRALEVDGAPVSEEHVHVPGSNTTGSHSSGPSSIDQWISDSADARASVSPTTSQQRWHAIASEPQLTEEPSSIFTSDQFRPISPSYFHLIPSCIDLFYEHIYPIMPLVHIPTLRSSSTRALNRSEKNLLYSLCALTSTHMSGKSITAPGPPSWEAAGRFFLDECISVRKSYDFIEDKSLSAVISSYFVSTAFFELNQNRKSWYYLREALTMGQDLRLHDEKSYAGLSPAEILCRQRTFWILYVTERSFAILRHKPLTLSKTPLFPSSVHSYESPSTHTGFMHLVNSYHLLDSSFVDTWNEVTSAPTSTLTYTALQNQLSQPQPSHVSIPDIQKADILVTQQWLRLIVWQSSMRQGLLSSTASDESMTFAYPLKIAHSLLSALSSLPTTSIEVHGMGIFEKIFEIGNTMLDVTHACGRSIPSASHGVAQDPFAVFVKTLSQTPNSQRQFANLLLAKAAEKPTIQRFAQPLAPGLGSGVLDGVGEGVFGTSQWRGSIVGEIGEDSLGTAHAQEGAEREAEQELQETEEAGWTNSSGEADVQDAVWVTNEGNGVWMGKIE